MTEYGSFTGRVDEKVPDSPSGNGFSFWRKKKFCPAPASTNLTSNTGAKKKKRVGPEKLSDLLFQRLCTSLGRCGSRFWYANSGKEKRWTMV